MGNKRSADTKVVVLAIAGGALLYEILMLLLSLLIILSIVFAPWRSRQESFSDFVQQVDRGAVSSIKIYKGDLTIEAELKNRKIFKTAFPQDYNITRLVEGKVEHVEIDPHNFPNSPSIIIMILPMLLSGIYVLILSVLAIAVFVYTQRRKSE